MCELAALLLTEYNKRPARSAWERGGKEYADELCERLKESDEVAITNASELEQILLNGARDWKEYSEGGCSLIYDYDIAERLCSPSELKRVKGGERNPNARETWLDVQARALRQTARRLISIYSSIIK